MTISSMKLKKKLIFQAVDVLRQTKNGVEESGKKALFEDDISTLYLQIMLKKIPDRNESQIIKVNLPHSLLKDTDEVCLITGDTNKNDRKAETEPDVLLYEALLDKLGITQISKVVTLRQLRTDYKPYADKQKLLAAYDVFLADNKIYECLPKVLGRFFYKKRKFPLKIDMASTNLKQEIEKALTAKRFYVTGNGNSCCSEVAYLDMSNSEIFANITEMVNTVSNEMPGSWNNIMGIYLKTARSVAIPIYVSFGNPNDVVLPYEEIKDEIVMGELSTKHNVNVKVHKDGKVELFSTKKCQETCFEEVKSDSQIKSEKVEILKSEMKGINNESSKKKKQKISDNKVDKSDEPIKEIKIVLDEDICVPDPGKKKNKSGKKKIQKEFEDEINESVICIADPEKKKNKSGKKKIQKEFEDEINESVICIADPEKKQNKLSKKKIQKKFNDEIDESLICMADPKSNNIGLKGLKHTDSTKKSKKGMKSVFEDSLKTPLLTDNNAALMGIKHTNSTKKSKKQKKNVIEDSLITPLLTEDFPEKMKKSTFKRKREQSESGSKEKESFLSFKSPKQDAKKKKVDSKNLEKKQPLKTARKKILQQKN